jgi:hypothetical protein
MKKNNSKSVNYSRKIILVVVILNLVSVAVFAQKSSDPIILNDIKAKSQRNVIPSVELIEYIDNPSSDTCSITSILYKLNIPKNGPTKIIKPHLYLATDKKVGKELLPTDIPLVYIKQKGKEIIVEVNISKYKIALPLNGVFVGLEFTGIVKETAKGTQNDDVLSVCNNRENISSISCSKYKNIFDKETDTSMGLCFSLEVHQ